MANTCIHSLFSKVTEDFGQAGSSMCGVSSRATFYTLLRASLFSPLTNEGGGGKSSRSADSHMLASEDFIWMIMDMQHMS